MNEGSSTPLWRVQSFPELTEKWPMENGICHALTGNETWCNVHSLWPGKADYPPRNCEIIRLRATLKQLHLQQDEAAITLIIKRNTKCFHSKVSTSQKPITELQNVTHHMGSSGFAFVLKMKFKDFSRIPRDYNNNFRKLSPMLLTSFKQSVHLALCTSFVWLMQCANSSLRVQLSLNTRCGKIK